MRHFTLFLAALTLLILCADIAAAADPAVKLPEREQFHLYLLIGQSNMAGRGTVEEQDKVPHPRVLMFTKENDWAPAVDPLHFDKPAIAGVGLGSSFGRAMAEADKDVTIGLIPCAVGGTPLSRWQKDGDLYQQAVKRAKAAMRDGTLKGILWHQGESDSGSEDTARSYGERLTGMVGNLREELAAGDVPFVAGELGGFLRRETKDGKPSYWPIVNEQIAALPQRVPNAVVASASGLKHKGDEVHFDSLSLRELGQRYAAAMRKLQSGNKQAARRDPLPNIVVILADDLGYGDVKCLNPDGKIATPHMNKLAAQGMVFTDAHSGSAVCSPTRYGLLTGRYAWRSKLQSGVLGGLSPRLIEPGRMTVASLLKKRGYQTACVGKWHLGMDWVALPGKSVAELNIESREQVNSVDYAQPIANGPTAVGFDRYFGISASLDMVPYTFIENDRVTKLPTEDRDFPLMLGRAQGRCRLGPAAPGFEVEDVLPALAEQACDWITSCAAKAKEGQPFFLYLPLASPHTPIAPLKEWQGKSGLNYYADFVMQTDAAIGEVLATLERQGLADSTLVLVTSDNGCSPQADFPALEAKGHDPSHIYRGHKADIFEGGHRVPFIVRWPGRVKPGSQADETVCLVDVLATCAEIVGEPLPDAAGEDSASLVPLLMQQPAAKVREGVVHHSINGSFAVRQGDWKLILCPGSGGWSAPRPGRDDASDLPLVQLYNLADDPREQKNVQDEQPEIVAKLTALLQKYIDDGRSTAGQPQKNAVPIDPWRAAKAAHAPLRAKAKAKAAKKD